MGDKFAGELVVLAVLVVLVVLAVWIWIGYGSDMDRIWIYG